MISLPAARPPVPGVKRLLFRFCKLTLGKPMKKWFQIQSWEYFLVAFLVAVCAQCWNLCLAYFDTVCIISIWIICIFRFRIPFSPKPFTIHIGIMSLAILCSLCSCISGETGWWMGPFFSANGAIRGSIISGAVFMAWNTFNRLYSEACA